METDVYYAGDGITTSWESSGLSSAYVVIDLYKGNLFVQILNGKQFDVLGNDFSYLDDDLPEGNDYQVKVSDFQDDSMFGYSSYFSIIDPYSRSFINVSSPERGRIYFTEKYLHTSWSCSELSSFFVTVDLYKGDFLVETLDDLELAALGHDMTKLSRNLSWGNDYRVKVTDYNGSTFGFSSTFTIINLDSLKIQGGDLAELSVGQIVGICFGVVGMLCLGFFGKSWVVGGDCGDCGDTS